MKKIVTLKPMNNHAEAGNLHMIQVASCIMAFVLLIAPLGASAGETAVDRGMKFFREGNYQEAMKAFHVSKNQDLNKEAYMAWGMSAFRLGKYESALLKLNKAFNIDPGDGNLLTVIAQCQLNLQKPVDALRSLRATEKLKVTDRGAADLLWAFSAGLTANHEEALQHFQPALTAKPDKEFEIRLGMADSLKELKRMEQAGEQVEKALRIRPGDPQATGRLGLIRLKMGKYVEAEQILVEAVRTNPNSAVNQYNLACARARLGEKLAACEALKSAFAQGVNQADAMTDEDLTPIRDEPCFKEIVKR
jgi:tetratricopeptide (TPR) repeat protein